MKITWKMFYFLRKWLPFLNSEKIFFFSVGHILLHDQPCLFHFLYVMSVDIRKQSCSSTFFYRLSLLHVARSLSNLHYHSSSPNSALYLDFYISSPFLSELLISICTSLLLHHMNRCLCIIFINLRLILVITLSSKQLEFVYNQ